MNDTSIHHDSCPLIGPRVPNNWWFGVSEALFIFKRERLIVECLNNSAHAAVDYSVNDTSTSLIQMFGGSESPMLLLIAAAEKGQSWSRLASSGVTMQILLSTFPSPILYICYWLPLGCYQTHPPACLAVTKHS